MHSRPVLPANSYGTQVWEEFVPAAPRSNSFRNKFNYVNCRSSAIDVQNRSLWADEGWIWDSYAATVAMTMNSVRRRCAGGSSWASDEQWTSHSAGAAQVIPPGALPVKTFNFSTNNAFFNWYHASFKLAPHRHRHAVPYYSMCKSFR